MIGRTTRLTVIALLGAGFALAAALWPSAAAPSRAGAEPATGALTGAQVFRAKGCAGCHDGPESTAPVPVAPDLGQLRDNAPRRVAHLDAVAYVRQSVHSPQAFVVPGFDTVMPTLPVSDEELDALVRYLLG